MKVITNEQLFGTFNGRQVKKYTITEVAGIQVSVINYGATITNLIVPDRSGSPADIVLGFDTLESYINAGGSYIGCICGRYASRISNAEFSINGNNYQLAKNDGTNCLHGGIKGFDKVVWNAEILPEGDGVTFTYDSKDGEEGFPGELNVSVTYRVNNNSLIIDFWGRTNKATPVNLTSHSYFNLSGDKEDDILTHELQLFGNAFVELNADLIPTGKLIPVKDSAMDFLEMHEIKKEMNGLGGYDHCWVLNNKNGELTKAATLFHRESGRIMTVYTTQPGILFYSGNFLDGSLKGTKKGKIYSKYAGLCLETQHFPDSPNHKKFPNTIIKPDEEYKQQTVYQFESIFSKT
jgi:aldose 1-epimerase